MKSLDRLSLNGPLPIPGSRRGRPGRPRKGDSGIFEPVSGHSAGHSMTEALEKPREDQGAPVRVTVVPIAPRLLDLETSASYLGVSHWTIREMLDVGVLPRVRIPLPNGGELRKILIDKGDLDRAVESWKEKGTNGSLR